MFRLRLAIDCAARAKNGQPPQTTTGAASAASISGRARPWARCRTKATGSAWAIAIAISGAVRTAAVQKRRDMSRSSGVSCSAPSRVTVRGSSAMPQIGQLPGRSRTISGCMGQVHSAAAPGRGAGAGRR